MTRIVWRPIKTTALIPGDRRSRRAPAAAAAVMVLLVAVIALAVRDDEPDTQAPAAGDAVASSTAQLVSRSRQGAADAAQQMAAALGSEAMFGEQSRRTLIEAHADPARREQLLADTAADYDRLARQIGLDEQGQPPAGSDFVSRTTPVKTTVHRYDGDTAVVDVWCSAVFGLTGGTAEDIPPSTSWLTMALSLHWDPSAGWKFTSVQQSDGPEPGQ